MPASRAVLEISECEQSAETVKWAFILEMTKATVYNVKEVNIPSLKAFNPFSQQDLLSRAHQLGSYLTCLDSR